MMRLERYIMRKGKRTMREVRSAVREDKRIWGEGNKS